MAKGLIGIGRVQKEQAMRALTESAKLEAEQQIANEALEQQRQMAEAQTKGTLAGTGAAIGYMAGASAGTIGGAAGGPVGAVIGLVGGYLLGELFS
tara:strand:- start:17502 stop:17789 length:288 start_codon:yes stop_codon:yes gene_type:complete